MAGLHFELVSPARLLFSGDVASVILPASEGEMTVLPEHAPVLSTLKAGVLVVGHADGKSERIFVRGGFAEINAKGLTVLAEQATPMQELNAEALAIEIKNAREDVADAKDDETRRKAQENLDSYLALNNAL